MSAATFVLAINVFVAGMFAVAFGTLAVRMRHAGAGWLALAYSLAIVNASLEFILPEQADPFLVNLAIYVVSLGAFLLCIVGLARHYTVHAPWLLLAILALGSVVPNALLMEEASTASFERAVIYQLPYFLAHLLAASVLIRAPKRSALDHTLLAFLLVSGLQFLVKPFMAVSLSEPGGTEVYLQSLYGAYSQLLTALLLIANGLLMLLVFMRDAIAELATSSETDKLSGLLNRRGFDNQADAALLGTRRAGVPGAMVVVDIDHFKTVNDEHGHEAGDRVIAGLAALVAAPLNRRAVAGRLGGEEFAVFLPGVNLDAARLFAEGVRESLLRSPVSQLPAGRVVTASFGVAQLQPADRLSDLLRRADAALYEAKRTGRNRVCTAGSEPIGASSAGAPGERRRGSRIRG